MSDPAIERWRPWTDADLRLLLERARATHKHEQATAIACELARREDSRQHKPAERFESGERAFLEALASLCEAWGASFESEERFYVRVGTRRWMAFQHLDVDAIKRALEEGGPPARRAPPGAHADRLAPELGGNGPD